MLLNMRAADRTDAVQSTVV